MRKPYKTKKRKKEFKDTYMIIGDLNSNISDLEIEIKCHLKYGAFDEAYSKQQLINKWKLELIEYARQGWDIEYITEKSTGWYVEDEGVELK